MKDEKAIRWVLKELMGYKHYLVHLDELQHIILTLLPQISGSEYDRKFLEN
jgi:L-lysine 2,3-aminomutase